MTYVHIYNWHGPVTPGCSVLLRDSNLFRVLRTKFQRRHKSSSLRVGVGKQLSFTSGFLNILSQKLSITCDELNPKVSF